MKRYQRLAISLCLVAMSMTISGRAYAYLDPGTASLVLQGVLGAVGAGIVVLGMYWRRFIGVFKKKKQNDDK